MRFGECCCGISLRAGTLIIGYLYATVGYLTTLICFGLLAVGTIITEETLNQMVESHDVVIGLATGGSFALIVAALAVSLIYGTHKNNRSFLLPWKLFSWAYFFVSLISTIVLVVILILLRDKMLLGVVAALLFNTGILIYFISVVESYSISLLPKQEYFLSQQKLIYREKI